jgi:hypothetical protein
MDAEELTSEAMSGRLRMTRRGNHYQMWFADDDSPVFRLTAEQTFDGPVQKVRTLQLRSIVVGRASTTVTWKKLRMSAESLERFRFGVRLRNLTDAERTILVNSTDLMELVLDGTDVSDELLAKLKGHVNLDLLYLKSTAVTSQGLTHLAGLKKLRTLHLTQSAIDDSAGETLAQLTELEELGVSATVVGDKTAEHLSRLPHLKVLGINRSAVTDAAVPYFQKMTTLRRLDLRNTQMSAAAIEQIRTALPGCNVQF